MKMEETARLLIQARAGGRVQRCHGITHHGQYSTAEHQWGVALLMFYLWPEDFPRLGIYCLVHDVAEAWVGDVPAPTVRYVPGLREQLGKLETTILRSLRLPPESDLSALDHTKLKACDRLELYLWAREQLLQGNQFAAEFIVELERYFLEAPLPRTAQELHQALQNLSCVPRHAGVMRELYEP